MNVLFLPLAALVRDEATAKLCRQIPRLIGAEFERATEAHGVKSKFLSSRGTSESGAAGLVASLEIPAPSDLETTARMYGADYVVSGRFGLGERNLVFEVRIYEASTRKEIYAKHFETYPSYYFDTVEEIKVRLAQILKLDLSDRERVALLKRATESWQALLYFLFAEDDRYALSLGIAGENPLSTLDLYKEALAIDPDFAQASDGMQHVILMQIEQSRIDISQLHTILSEYHDYIPQTFREAIAELL